jgi:hypothetical protein
MMLATSTLWSVPGGSSVMPANEKSPLHGLLIAPQAVQPASIRSVGMVRGREAGRLVDSSRVTGAAALATAALATVAVAAGAEPFAALAVAAAVEPFATVAVAAVAAAAAAEPFAAVAIAGRGGLWLRGPRRFDPKWLKSDGRHSRASSGLVGALEPPKRSGNGT